MDSKDNWKKEEAKDFKTNHHLSCVHCDPGFVNDPRCICKGSGLVNDACVCRRMYAEDVAKISTNVGGATGPGPNEY